jgi:putative tryptophan/tyrosine transport system substrate-binding protein
MKASFLTHSGPKPVDILQRSKPLTRSSTIRYVVTDALPKGRRMQFDRLQRREFITLLGGGTAWPLAARAQQQAMPVVGYLSAGTPEAERLTLAAFRQGLAEAGYIEGRNVIIEYRFGQNQPDRLPELAADLVRGRVVVIVAPGGMAQVRAAKAATTAIPIVFTVAVDPIEQGLVASLNRPGGNLTGFAQMNTEIVAKRLGLLHELIPGAARFAVLRELSSPPTPSGITGLRAAASSIGLQVEEIVVAGTPRDIDMAFATLVQKRVDALLVNPNPLFFGLRTQFAALAARHAIAAIYWDRAFAEAGGLMSYGSSLTDQFRQVGIYTGRILKGEKPADLPVLQPTKFELVINAKTAKTLGLDVPDRLLALADEVIE